MFKRELHNPLHVLSMEDSCDQAVNILNDFFQSADENALIPEQLRHSCYGVAILSFIKAGLVVSGTYGGGIVICKKPVGQALGATSASQGATYGGFFDSEWGAPVLIGTSGLGVGATVGAEIVDAVVLLNQPEAVELFKDNAGHFTLGASASFAMGPLGRDASYLKSTTTPAFYIYSKSAGLFAGFSLEGSVFSLRKELNEEAYGLNVSPTDIIEGRIPIPSNARRFVDVVRLRFGGAPIPSYITPADKAKAAVGQAVAETKEAASEVSSGIQSTASSALSSAQEAVSAASTTVKHAAQTVASTAMDVAAAVPAAVSTAAHAALNAAASVPEVVHNVASTISSAASSAKETLAPVTDVVSSAASSVASTAASVTKQAVEAVPAAASSAASAAQEVARAAPEAISHAATATKEAVSSAAQTAKDVAAPVTSAVSSAASTAKDTLSSAAQSAKEKVSEAAVTAKETVSSAAQSAKDTVSSAASSVQQAASSATEAAKEKVSAVAASAEAAAQPTNLVSMSDIPFGAPRELHHPVGAAPSYASQVMETINTPPSIRSVVEPTPVVLPGYTTQYVPVVAFPEQLIPPTVIAANAPLEQEQRYQVEASLQPVEQQFHISPAMFSGAQPVEAVADPSSVMTKPMLPGQGHHLEQQPLPQQQQPGGANEQWKSHMNQLLQQQAQAMQPENVQLRAETMYWFVPPSNQNQQNQNQNQ